MGGYSSSLGYLSIGLYLSHSVGDLARALLQLHGLLLMVVVGID